MCVCVLCVCVHVCGRGEEMCVVCVCVCVHVCGGGEEMCVCVCGKEGRGYTHV